MVYKSSSSQTSSSALLSMSGSRPVFARIAGRGCLANADESTLASSSLSSLSRPLLARIAGRGCLANKLSSCFSSSFWWTKIQVPNREQIRHWHRRWHQGRFSCTCVAARAFWAAALFIFLRSDRSSAVSTAFARLRENVPVDSVPYQTYKVMDVKNKQTMGLNSSLSNGLACEEIYRA